MSVNSTAVDNHEKLVSACLETQSMIDIAAKQLFGLRQCSGTDELIKKETWESETKLVCLFCKMMSIKAKIKDNDQLLKYPKIEQWLEIVGINRFLIEVLSHKFSFQTLLDCSSSHLVEEMKKAKANENDIRLLTTAMKNLKKCKENKNSANSSWSTLDYHWTNFKPSLPAATAAATVPIPNSVSIISNHNSFSNSPHLDNSPKFHHRHHHQQRPSTSSLPNETAQLTPRFVNHQILISCNAQHVTQPSTVNVVETQNQLQQQQQHHYLPGSPHLTFMRHTPSPTPQLKSSKNSKFPTTPPPNRKNKLIFEPLTKSKSHESQLSLKINLENTDNKKISKRKPGNIFLVGSSETIPTSCFIRKRSSGNSEDIIGRISGQSSPLFSSPFRSPQTNKFDEGGGENSPFRSNQLNVPPLSPGGAQIRPSSQHNFQTVMIWTKCDYCKKTIFRGKVCFLCKCKFHRNCVKNAPICKCINEDSYLYRQQQQQQHFINNNNNNLLHQQQQQQPQQQHLYFNSQQQHFDSSSTSSGNSSTPSSPSNTSFQQQQQQHHYHYQQQHYSNSNQAQQFIYPDTKQQSSSGYVSENNSMNTPTVAVSNADAVNTNASSGSDKTVTGSGSSSGDQNANLDHCDSVDSSEDNALHRDNSISIGLKEWNIPYNELRINEFVGAGRFGTVHKGYWHGEVAIKELNWCTNTDDQVQLQAFKLEVTNLRKTRHENLVLFIGACMEPPKLAIITSFVNGLTLYEKLHVRKEKMPINHVVIIASQIIVGLGYLHSKGIIHKDLKTKNVFIESSKNSSATSKVVISDYGLFCVTKLCYGARKVGRLEIPNGWLSYISPEIARKLKVGNQAEVDLPFSKESDIYAFGTIWYELLTGDIPHDRQPPECVIWRVGKGQHHPIINLQTEFKEILMKCWSLEPTDRPMCQQIFKSLEMLPKKRLARSPSHPVHLSRSAESLF